MTGEERKVMFRAQCELRETLHALNDRVDHIVQLLDQRLFLGATLMRQDDDRSIAIGVRLQGVQVMLADVLRQIEVRP